jgi:cytochrome c oxidase subunit 4
MHGNAVGHVVPVYVLLAVFAALIALTGLTVAAAGLNNLGGWSLAVALGIATVKGTLVALYFMHLRYDHPFNGLLFLVALVFLGLFMGLVLLDTQQYQPDIDAYQQSNGL